MSHDEEIDARDGAAREDRPDDIAQRCHHPCREDQIQKSLMGRAGCRENVEIHGFLIGRHKYLVPQVAKF